MFEKVYTVTANFNNSMGQMTKMSRQKNSFNNQVVEV